MRGRGHAGPGGQHDRVCDQRQHLRAIGIEPLLPGADLARLRDADAEPIAVAESQPVSIVEPVPESFAGLHDQADARRMPKPERAAVAATDAQPVTITKPESDTITATTVVADSALR